MSSHTDTVIDRGIHIMERGGIKSDTNQHGLKTYTPPSVETVPDDNIDEHRRNYFFKYITTVSDLDAAILDIATYVSKCPLIAVVVEGVNLSRVGTVSILAVATKDKIYLFDVIQLGNVIFSNGLQDIFENKQIEKLLFDCRAASDAIWHLFNVNMLGIVDVQLLEVLKRPDFEEKYDAKIKRSERHKEIFTLKTLTSCIYQYVKGAEMLNSMRRVGIKIKISKNVWAQRPLPVEFLVYSACGVKSLFLLFDQFEMNDEEMTRLRISSHIFNNITRSMKDRLYNEYELNGYLPIDVLPLKDQADFVTGSTLCNGCKREFPENEFSNAQLRKGAQMCRVCKKVKSDKDGQSPYMKSKFGSQ